MNKLHWVGIIRTGDIAKYQDGTLPENAVKLSTPEAMGKMMVKALPWAIPPFLLLLAALLVKRQIFGHSAVQPLFVIIGFVIGFLLLPLHELLHGAAYPKGASVYIGFDAKSLTAVALASHPLSRARFIFMSALPVILGLVPLIAFWVLPGSCTVPNSLLLGISIMGCMSPYPDFYNIYQVVRQTPPKCRLQFWRDDLYYIE